MARGVVDVLDPLEGDMDDAAPLELPDAPLVLLPLVDAPLAPDIPLELPLDASFDDPLGVALLGDVVLGDVVLGEVLLGEVLLEASVGVLLPDVLLPDVLDPLLDAGWLRLTSPPDVPVTVLLGDALLVGTQSVLVPEADDAPVVEDDMPLDVLLGLVVLPLVDASVLPVVEAVVPVPLAPFVVFGPVKRCSGFVAVLRAESVAAPVAPVAPVALVAPVVEPLADVEPGLIVVVAE